MIKRMMPLPLVIHLLLLLMVPNSGYSSGHPSSAVLTHVKGSAFTAPSPKGPWKALNAGMKVYPNQVLKTGKKSRLELTLPDRSIIRMAPDSVLNLNKIDFPKKKSRRFSAGLILGKIWAKVTRSVRRSGDSFNIHTATAVAGVRGTVYQVESHSDQTTLVSVYEGFVGVGPPIIMEGAPKEEIAWPEEVSEQKWEEIILGQLQRLRIGPDGKPGKPEPIDPAEKEGDWIKWNKKRDRIQ